MAKVIWHKAASLPQMDGSIIFARFHPRDPCALPWGHIGATWQIWLNCASFSPPKSTTQTANQSVQPFLHSSWQIVVGHARACPSPNNCGGSGPHVIHASLGPPESITQMAAPSVQPFLHRWAHSAPIRYNGSPLPPQNYPFPWGMWTPSNILFLGQTPVFNPNGTLIGWAIFYKAH